MEMAINCHRTRQILQNAGTHWIGETTKGKRADIRRDIDDMWDARKSTKMRQSSKTH